MELDSSVVMGTPWPNKWCQSLC